MADPVETDCEKDYRHCKSKCFGVLVEGLADAGGDASKEEEARARYKRCLALCKKAKRICDAEPAD